MLLYDPLMPNTKSAKKANRSSLKKKAHNLLWKAKYKASVKAVKSLITGSAQPAAEAAKEALTKLQKNLDKSAKEKVIHKNKANRLKSRYAKKLSVQPAAKKSAKK